jgi:hypothetical protein
LEVAPDHRTVFQLTSKRWTICPGDPWGAETPRSRLVAIGLAGSASAIDWSSLTS